MTTYHAPHGLLEIVGDLAAEVSDTERQRHILRQLRSLVPCDAAALLRLDGDQLIPLAVDGLAADTLGRRFKVSEHPRLEAFLAASGPMRFGPDCTLPDPYDGLVERRRGPLEVHDCLGCPLRVAGRTWGLLTLDALDPAQFSRIDLDALAAFARVAAAALGVAERLAALQRHAELGHQLAETYRQVAGQAPRPEMIGQSAAFRRLQSEISVVAGSDLTVLIGGETGVGKELVAHAIHARSARASQPLITVNCASLAEAHAESELFGRVQDAAAGAGRSGKLELAEGGTLFLDEVGELPLAAQGKLLRVLQSGQLQRVGSDEALRVNVRIIAATNRDLAGEVRAGRLRADLYPLRSVYPLVVPPWGERPRDVLLLAGYFLEQNRPRLPVRGLRLTQDAQAALLAYDWPGNVRELAHVIGRASLKALAASSDRTRVLSIAASDLGLPGPRRVGELDAAPDRPLRDAVDDFKRRLIESALQRNGRRWAAAARELGLDRANLHRLAERLGLSD
jgi:anaerobic nitric oxide reductase transcription regulator